MRSALIGILFAVACTPAPVFPPGPGGEGCAPMCENLDRLGCEWSASPGPDDEMGTMDDVPCLGWCEDLEARGMPVASECAARASSCEAAADCPGDA